MGTTWRAMSVAWALACVALGCKGSNDTPAPSARPTAAKPTTDGGTRPTAGATAGPPAKLDFKLGFAPSTERKGALSFFCDGGAIFRGAAGPDGRPTTSSTYIGAACTSGVFYADAKAPRLTFAIASPALTALTLAAQRVELVEGAATIEVDAANLLAKTGAIVAFGFDSKVEVPFTAEGPDGPYVGSVTIKAYGFWDRALLAVTRGPVTLAGERPRPFERRRMLVVAGPDAKGGALPGLYTSSGRVNDYAIRGEDLDLIAIDVGTTKVLGSCDYVGADGSRAKRHKTDVHGRVVVYERRTGTKLAEKKFPPPGRHPGCAAQITSADGTFVNRASDAEYEAFYQTVIDDSYQVADPAAVTAPGSDDGRMSRFAGLSWRSKSADVLALLGPSEVRQVADGADHSWADATVTAFVDGKTDQLTSFSVSTEGIEFLRSKGVKDPLLDLFGKPKAELITALGAVTNTYSKTLSWSDQRSDHTASVAFTCYDDRGCEDLDLTWTPVEP